MLLPKKTAALTVGFIAVLSAVSIAQNPAPADAEPSKSAADVLILSEDATLEWIEKADVAALREGTLKSMELQIGMQVAKGGEIGKLHDEIAALTTAKAAIAANAKASREKATAQKRLAEAVVARNQRLQSRGPDYVSKEEIEKAVAEVYVAEAMVGEANEKLLSDKAEYELAKRVLEEHTILAPFSGVVYERLKNPGESVRANEPVVRLGNLDKLRAWAYVPLDYVTRIKEGQEVEIQLRLQGSRNAPLAIEQKKFRGKITFVDPQVAPEVAAAVRIGAEFENKNRELRPGFKATMTIFLTPETAPAARTVGANTQPAGAGR